MRKYSRLEIDGDALVHIAASMAEKTFYDKYGTGECISFPTMKDAYEAGYEKPFVRRQEPGSTKEAYIIMHNIINKWVSKLGCSSLKFYLSDTTRALGRTKVYPAYKLNRDKQTRALHVANLRDYLLKNYDTLLVEGLEADDLLGMHKQPDGITVSHDKDIRQIPGTHYDCFHDWVIESDDPGMLKLSKDKKKLLGTGFKFTCALAICGDTSDNIPGVKGIGPATTYNLLKDCGSNAECYKKAMKQFKDKDYAELMFRLVWIPRTPDEDSMSFLDYVGE